MNLGRLESLAREWRAAHGNDVEQGIIAEEIVGVIEEMEK